MVKKFKKNFLIIIAISLLLIVSTVFLIYLSEEQIYKNTFKNTKIYGVDVSGLNVSEATTKVINNYLNKTKDKTLILKYKDKQWEYTPSQEIKTNVFEIITDRYNSITNKPLKEKINVFNLFKSSEKNIESELEFMVSNFDTNLSDIMFEIEKESVEPQVVFNANSIDMFTFKKESNGLKINKKELLKSIEDYLNNKSLNNIIEIPVEEVKCSVDIETLKKNTVLKGKFYTDFSSSSEARKHNVKLALSSINNLVIKPNETISFNNLTGLRNTENGYKKAKIIFDGEFIDGVGGGVCQVSTTLYNALLLSDLEIVKSQKHSLPVSYVEKGFDAMVSENGSDLVFRNNTLYPIYIKANAINNKAFIEIYGTPNEYEIKKVSKVIKTINAPKDKIEKDVNQKYTDKVLFVGEYYRLKKGYTGYEVETNLEYYKDGKLIFTKPIRHVTYKPVQGILIEGIEELPDSFSEQTSY